MKTECLYDSATNVLRLSIFGDNDADRALLAALDANGAQPKLNRHAPSGYPPWFQIEMELKVGKK